MKLPYGWRNFDLALLSMVLLLAGIGVVLVYSASHHSAQLSQLAYRQLMWVGVGVFVLSFFYIVDYQSLINLSYVLYFLIAVILVGLIMFGRESDMGSTRWIDLGFFYFQPSEMAKLVIILSLTRYVTEHDRDIQTLLGLLKPLLMAAFMMLLILKQPDLGTSLVLFPVTVVMLFVAGARLWHLLLLLGSMAASTPLLWMFLKDYQKRRWLSFLDPESDALGAGYNTIQSKIAIGSGGLWGKGFLQGTQSQLNFVPMHHTDFVFAVLGEEWGFAGCVALLTLYAVWLLHCVKIATRARDLSGTVLISGVVTMLVTQIVVNIGMTTGLLPVTGLPLPLISYGGSSILLVMVCMGILLSIRRESSGF